MPLRGASPRRSYLFYSFRSLVQEPRGGGRALLLVSCLFAFAGCGCRITLAGGDTRRASSGGDTRHVCAHARSQLTLIY